MMFSSRTSTESAVCLRNRLKPTTYKILRTVTTLVLIEIFSLIVMAEVLRANIDWKSAFLNGDGQFRPNFYIGRGVSANHFCADR